jgi:hypothetical protein
MHVRWSMSGQQSIRSATAPELNGLAPDKGQRRVKPGFSLQCSYNRYLPEGGSEVNAILTLAPEPSQGPRLLRSGGGEVIVVDISGSMEGFKLQEARNATIAAIDCIGEGVHFGVVAGNETATQVYPACGLVPANGATRDEAKRCVRRLKPSGGTAIGEWISLTARLLEQVNGYRHAILLTDGKDEHETPEALRRALASASGVFQCDCRGVGTDWSVPELRRVATALLGSVEIVADPAELTTDFEGVMRQAMGRGVSDVRLRIWVPKGAEILTFKQVAPELLDLSGMRASPADPSREYATGGWDRNPGTTTSASGSRSRLSATRSWRPGWSRWRMVWRQHGP